MYTMKQACELTNLPYETLKFYCNEGLVPNVRRDKNNYRIFSDRNIRWINNLNCLKRCGMSIKNIKEYLALCLQGESSIPQRMEMLAVHRKDLVKKLDELNKNLAYHKYRKRAYHPQLRDRPFFADYFNNDSISVMFFLPKCTSLSLTIMHGTLIILYCCFSSGKC